MPLWYSKSFRFFDLFYAVLGYIIVCAVLGSSSLGLVRGACVSTPCSSASARSYSS